MQQLLYVKLKPILLFVLIDINIKIISFKHLIQNSKNCISVIEEDYLFTSIKYLF